MWWYVILTAVVVLVYGRVIGFGLLLWDDDLVIRTNRLLFPKFTWSCVVEIFHDTHLGMYMPVTLCFFGFEAWISQHLPWSDTEGVVHAWVFHLGNLSLHVVCVSLVYAILKDLVIHRRAAFLGALVFALHPLQAEPVAWVTETKTLMGAVWLLAAVCVYLRHEAEFAVTTPTRRGWGWRKFVDARYVLASMFFVVALLSKPTTVVTPVVAGTLAWWFHGRNWRRQFVLLGPWLLLAGIVAMVTKAAQPDAVVHTVPDLFGRLLVAGDAMAFYLIKLIFPVHLAMDYGRTPVFVLGNTWSYVAWIIPLAMLLLLFRFGRRGPFFVAYLVFLAALVPVMGLVPFEFQNISTVADRYVYLAMFGPALAGAAIVDRNTTRWKTIGAVVLVAMLGAASFHQAGFWRDDITLYTRALDIRPGSHAALVNLAVARLQQGTHLNASVRDQAEQLLHRAVQVAPTPEIQAKDLTRIATAMLTRGNVEGAVKNLLQAQRLKPDDAKVYCSLGDALAVAGQFEAALQQYQKSTTLDPKFVNPYCQSGDMLRKLGRLEEAEAAFRRALQLRPGWSVALRGLAGCLADSGNDRQAEKTFDEAIQSGPNQWQNYYEKGLFLFRVGRFEEAAKSILKASQLNPSSARVHNDLATTLVKLRRLSEAAMHYRKAIQLDPRLDEARTNLSKVESAMRGR